jgi:hypothetical protein
MMTMFKLERRPERAALVCVAIAAIGASAVRGQHVEGRAVLDAVPKIVDEGLQRSQVMNLAGYLTDVYGPRLTGSPNFREAAEWAERTFAEWGVADVRREAFIFGRGWENRRFVAQALTPRAFPLVGAPRAWSAGTDGPVTGEALRVPLATEDEFAVWRTRLRGKFVLSSPPRNVVPSFEPLATRFSDAALAALLEPGARVRHEQTGPPRLLTSEFARKRLQFMADEGVAALIEPTPIGDAGTVFVQGAAGASRDPASAAPLPQVVLAVEDYNRLARTIARNIPVTLQLEIDNRFYDDDPNGFSVIGEIRGSERADEVVLIGAHLDSWQGGTGATDDAAGVAVVMEAMRILAAIQAPLRRTVRVALWGGEEQGLLGSTAYVRAHLADAATMTLLSDHAKLSAYYNVDNGGGRIRGVYLQGNDRVAGLFDRWIEPLRGLGVTTLAARSVGNTDHVPFDEVGIPAFQFIQDPLEYETRTHHATQDVYDRLVANDLMRNAVIVAAFAYETANLPDRLSRKPLPAPQTTRLGQP